MPDLSPQTRNKVGLRDDWYIPVSNPLDENDKDLCVQITQGPFHHVIVKFNNFKFNCKASEFNFFWEFHFL